MNEPEMPITFGLPLRPGPADFQEPPWADNAAGRPRRVGIEIEFTGLSAVQAAHRLAGEFGGNVVAEGPHAVGLHGTRFGDLQLLLDTRYAHPDKGNALLSNTLLGALAPTVAAWIGSAASYIVPYELVTDPLPVAELHEVDRLVAVLREAGAKGTQDAALYAFGLHFNPEVPRLHADTIAAILKAFVLLNPWLRREVAPDTTRHLLGFADPFPADYVRRLVDPGYQPDLPAFIDDYLAANPTRNRDLDLLPLLLHLDRDRVRRALPDEKISGRSAFHYRLPDARVSDPGWSIAPDWNRWVAVERLAADRERLAEVGRAYLAYEGEAKSWADIVERIALR